MSSGFRLYRVQGQSMAPTLRAGDYVLARPCQEPAREPTRGDIVVLATASGKHLKRVIALPGEHVVFSDGALLIDGERLVEPYLHGLPPYLGLQACEYSLAADRYFVMGDNRTHSTDSRHGGPVVRSDIEGRTVCRVWPLVRRRNLPGRQSRRVTDG